MSEAGLQVDSVLVHVGLDRLGDGLLKLPFARGLREAFPDAKLTWFAGKETTVYARSLKPLVDGVLDEVIEYGGVGAKPAEMIGPRPMQGRCFDLVIDTQRIFWTALSAMRIRHRRFISPTARFLLSDIKPAKGYRFPKPMQRQMLDLLQLATGREFPTPAGLDLPLPDRYVEAARAALPDGRRHVAFAPGSGGRPKCWPLDRFIEVARRVAATGDVPVFLIGPQEQEWAEIVRAQLPGALLPLQDPKLTDAFGFDPLLTIALAGRMAAAVSNDSGVAHMLAVGGAPLVALYGPTVYEKFPPMAAAIEVVKAEKFGGREMTFIPVDAVISALASLPAKAAGRLGA